MKKKCSKCQINKLQSEFAKNKSMADGHRKVCKTCCNVYNKSYYRNQDNKNKMKNQTFIKKYGLSLEQLQSMFLAQKDECAICKIHKSNTGKKTLMVDHCHSSNNIRELLCANCNVILGMCYDNEEILYNAILYLRKHKAKQ